MIKKYLVAYYMDDLKELSRSEFDSQNCFIGTSEWYQDYRIADNCGNTMGTKRPQWVHPKISVFVDGQPPIPTYLPICHNGYRSFFVFLSFFSSSYGYQLFAMVLSRILMSINLFSFSFYSCVYPVYPSLILLILSIKQQSKQKNEKRKRKRKRKMCWKHSISLNLLQQIEEAVTTNWFDLNFDIKSFKNNFPWWCIMIMMMIMSFQS